MLAYPGMIAEAARKAGIEVPADPDGEFDPEKYVRFSIFCTVQLGRPMTSWNEHWDNAHVIANIPENRLKTITLAQLIGCGLHIATSH